MVNTIDQAYNIQMPNNRPLEPWQIADAKRLKALWKSYAREHKISQEDAAPLVGLKQSAFSQYLNGIIPLNIEKLLDFGHLLRCKLSDISPTLSAPLYRWIDDAERHSLITIETFLDQTDLKLLDKSDIRALEALAKHLIATKKENAGPGNPKLRPRLLELVGSNKSS